MGSVCGSIIQVYYETARRFYPPTTVTKNTLSGLLKAATCFANLCARAETIGSDAVAAIVLYEIALGNLGGGAMLNLTEIVGTSGGMVHEGANNDGLLQVSIVQVLLPSADAHTRNSQMRHT